MRTSRKELKRHLCRIYVDGQFSSVGLNADLSAAAKSAAGDATYVVAPPFEGRLETGIGLDQFVDFINAVSAVGRDPEQEIDVTTGWDPKLKMLRLVVRETKPGDEMWSTVGDPPDRLGEYLDPTEALGLPDALDEGLGVEIPSWLPQQVKKAHDNFGFGEAEVHVGEDTVTLQLGDPDQSRHEIPFRIANYDGPCGRIEVTSVALNGVLQSIPRGNDGRLIVADRDGGLCVETTDNHPVLGIVTDDGFKYGLQANPTVEEAPMPP